MSSILCRCEEQRCTHKDPDAQKNARMWKEKKKEYEGILQRVSSVL